MIIVILTIIYISLKLEQVDLEHEKYGKDICGDGYGQFCACSQMTIQSGPISSKCDYSKPVKDLNP